MIRVMFVLIMVLSFLGNYFLLEESLHLGERLKLAKISTTECEANSEAVDIYLDHGDIAPVVDRLHTNGWLRQNRESLPKVDNYETLKD